MREREGLLGLAAGKREMGMREEGSGPLGTSLGTRPGTVEVREDMRAHSPQRKPVRKPPKKAKKPATICEERGG
jgi:hypothetical protein